MLLFNGVNDVLCYRSVVGKKGDCFIFNIELVVFVFFNFVDKVLWEYIFFLNWQFGGFNYLNFSGL